jgi:hypothetical protein
MQEMVIITEQYPLPRSSLGNCKVDGKVIILIL